MLHDCEIVKELDEYAWKEQYFIQCKCHMGDRWMTWRPGDPEFVCPQEGSHDTRNNMPTTDE